MIRQYGARASERASWHLHQAEETGSQNCIQRWQAITKAIEEMGQIASQRLAKRELTGDATELTARH
jgi:hypothetical protein